MPKFFVERYILESESEIVITGADKHHMTDVLRMQTGEEAYISDLSGKTYRCVLSSYDTDKAVLVIIERLGSSNEPVFSIKVFQGLPKSDRMDTVVRDCTQLGASMIIPVICSRSVSRIRDDADAHKKTERWQKIALEAAKQCGRDRVPVVGRPVSFKEAVKLASQSEVRFIPWECEDSLSLKAYLKRIDGNCCCTSKDPQTADISFIVGPEGGFDASETELAVSSGIMTVSLGKRILRTETASPAVLAMLLYEFEMDDGSDGSDPGNA